jgi:siderophore synthetase component
MLVATSSNRPKPRPAPGLTLAEVRRWARAQRISRAAFAQVHDDALLLAVSRLLQSIHREGYLPASALRKGAAGRWSLDVGRAPMLKAPVSGPLPFRRLELTGPPWTIHGGRRRIIRTPRAFMRALRWSLRRSELAGHFDRLAAHFDNSFANLVLNRLLGQRLARGAKAIEPVHLGHHYHPFPGLRIGPSLKQVVRCSNLTRHTIDIPLVAVGQGRFDSVDFDDQRACLRKWADLSWPPGAGAVIPVHPWQLELSPIVTEMLRQGRIVRLDATLEAVPLASQRTCRIVATGFDVKLPINATLTSEVRLLYPLNRANAPTVSALARLFLAASGEDALDFQYDVASIAHDAPRADTHLAAIVRSPVPRRAGDVVIPALNLWGGPRGLPGLGGVDFAYEFFRAYCRVLMRGPVDFYARWGMALEPHLQNVYIVLRNGMPSRIVLRDLDATILDPARIRPVARAHDLRLAPETWRHMPSYESGGLRLTHAMLYGHLGEVMSCLVRTTRVDLEKLSDVLEDTWRELIAAAAPSGRRVVRGLRAQSDSVRAMLRRELAPTAPT